MFTDWNGYGIRADGTIMNKDGSVKKFKKNRNGYLFTNFYYDKKLHTRLIHRVVWEAFCGEIPIGYELDHKNNVRDDNRINNLQLLTKSQNNKKAYDSGNRNFIFGDTNPNSLRRKYGIESP
jgi:hypothetical protein